VSGGARSVKGIGTRALQAASFAMLLGLLYGATRLAPHAESTVESIAAVGWLLLAGTLASELLEPLGVPHLTGYLIAGVIGGPYALHLVSHETVESLSQVNALALALIALAGGAELRISTLRKSLVGLSVAILVQTSFVLSGMTVVFLLLRPFVPFVAGMEIVGATGVALLWASLSVTRSPSASLGILAQTRAVGPVATFTLSFVMTSDVVVVVLLASVITVVRPMIEPGASFSPAELTALGHELVGSVAVGTTLGLVLTVYLRAIGTQLVLVLVALGFVASEVMHYLRFDALLSFMVAGFVVQNFSKQGPKFLHAIEQMGSVVYIVFFAIAGAHLDLPLLRIMWPVALALASARAAITWGASRVGSNLAGDPASVRKWGFSGLVSQAGLTLGLSSVIERAFPTFGSGFRALAIATVALNEIVGPILFKFALDRAGETSPPRVSGYPSLRPSAPPRAPAP